MPIPSSETVAMVENALPGWKVVEGPAGKSTSTDPREGTLPSLSMDEMAEAIDAVRADTSKVEVLEGLATVRVRPSGRLDDPAAEKAVVVGNGRVVAVQG